jgi:hypothetical protein
MNVFKGKKIKLLSDLFNEITLNPKTGEIFCGGAQLKFGTDYLLLDGDGKFTQVVDHDDEFLMLISFLGE